MILVFPQILLLSIVFLEPFLLDLVSFCEALRSSLQLCIMERGEIEDLVGERVRAVVSERQNELLDGINSMLSARFDIMEKSFGENNRRFRRIRYPDFVLRL